MVGITSQVSAKDGRINHVIEDETDTDSDVELITSICLEEEYVSQVSDNEYPKENLCWGDDKRQLDNISSRLRSFSEHFTTQICWELRN